MTMADGLQLIAYSLQLKKSYATVKSTKKMETFLRIVSIFLYFCALKRGNPISSKSNIFPTTTS